jgi:N-methylhydantoinase A/oxoprolinase/acetone carboxylase beta subunit
VVPWPGFTRDESLTQLRKRFDDLHERRFGHRAPDAAVEVVSYRVVGYGLVHHPPPLRRERRGASLAAAKAGERQVLCRGSRTKASVFQRDQLDVGHVLRGPAVVLQSDCTTIVEPEQTAVVDEWANLVITRAEP